MVAVKPPAIGQNWKPSGSVARAYWITSRDSNEKIVSARGTLGNCKMHKIPKQLIIVNIIYTLLPPPPPATLLVSLNHVSQYPISPK
jgi:hypothetical protein